MTGKGGVSLKWVYLFSEGNASMIDVLGGKGTHLCEMANMGLPVPPGFVISTEACNAYYAEGEQFPPTLWDQVVEALRVVEKEMGKRFGDPQNPLLVSARSGGKVSMPGMMDTVLNLGLNEETVRGLVNATGSERFAADTYRRFIQMFGKTVLGIDASLFEAILEQFKLNVGVHLDTELSAENLKEIVSEFRRLVKAEIDKEFPDDPLKQLRLSIEAVFKSWNGRRAVDYRNFHKIPHDLGTAVSIMAMVFGNMGDDSGSGVAFTRDPATGDKTLYGEYLTNAQGEDVVAGIRTPQKVHLLQQEMPDVYRELVNIAERLEANYRDVQDIEFTVEQAKLYILQTRAAKRTGRAAVKAAVDMVREGLLTKEEALLRVKPDDLRQCLFPKFDERTKEEVRNQGRLLARGLNASPGAATGKVVLDADRAAELGSSGESIILVRPETSAEDVHGMLVAAGILTARGGATSHAAVVARGLGKPCVAGCEELRIDLEGRYMTAGGMVVKEDEEISIDGSTGEVFIGRIPTIAPKLSGDSDLIALLGWANEVKRLGVWANADYPSDAARALEFGAEGIGLCRTEHIFFEEERLPIVQKMILSATEATAFQNELDRLKEEIERTYGDRQGKLKQRLAKMQEERDASPVVADYRDALAELAKFQIESFKGVLSVMAGKPVIIRLIDPPLHEFLPSYERVLVATTEFRIRSNDPAKLAESENLLRAIERMREANPMMGLRGCRVGLMFTDIYKMQVRAILTAACELAKEGIDVRPKIMVPLVGHQNEMRFVREQLEKVALEVEAEMGTTVDCKIGTMIEIPRAALIADEIAHYAEFFSFGTNDLTQYTFGFSRDDAEGKFLLQYVERGILPENPFQVLDRDGVGKLIKAAVELGRKARPDLELGICGEHGGDPSSIHFCHQVGLDYVSCSPFGVPIARLAAAQAALSVGEG